jgi:hypothetical protein
MLNPRPFAGEIGSHPDAGRLLLVIHFWVYRNADGPWLVIPGTIPDNLNVCDYAHRTTGYVPSTTGE